MALPAKQTRYRVRKRDQQIQRMTAHLRRLAPHLGNYLFTPTIHAFCRITITLERSYATIRDESLISTETGELRSSVDTVRKLAETQSRLARELGLTPATLRAFSKEKLVDLAAAMADKDDDEEEALEN